MFIAGLNLATTFQYAFNPNNGGPEDDAPSVPGATTHRPAGGRSGSRPCGVAPDTVIIELAQAAWWQHQHGCLVDQRR